MPRKKTKHHFRRGSEQKYHKLAVYSTRNTTSGIHFPLGWLLTVTCLAAGIVSLSLFRTQLIELVNYIPTISLGNPFASLSHIQWPSFALPSIKLPHIQVPDVLFDITGLWSAVSNFVRMGWTVTLNGVEQVWSFAGTVATFATQYLLQGVSFITDYLYQIMTAIAAIDFTPAVQLFFAATATLLRLSHLALAVSVAYLNPLLLFQNSISIEAMVGLFWWQTVLLLPTWFVTQYWGIEVFLTEKTISVSQIILTAFVTGSLSLWTILSEVAMVCIRFVQSIVGAIGAFFTAIAQGIGSILHAISVKWQGIVKTVSPYVQFLVDTFKLCLSELKTSIIVVSRVSRDVLSMYHENTKSFSQ